MRQLRPKHMGYYQHRTPLLASAEYKKRQHLLLRKLPRRPRLIERFLSHLPNTYPSKMRFDTYHFISLTLLLSGKILAADPVNEAGRRQVFDPTITKPTITKTYIPSISWLSRSTSTPEPVTTSTKKTTTSTSTQKSSTSTSKPYYPPTSTTLKTSTTSSKTSTGGEVGPTSSKCPVPLYYQCGGATWTGCKTCEKGSYCKTQNEFYYQCVAEE